MQNRNTDHMHAKYIGDSLLPSNRKLNKYIPIAMLFYNYKIITFSDLDVTKTLWGTNFTYIKIKNSVPTGRATLRVFKTKIN